MIISAGGHLPGEKDTRQSRETQQARIGAPDRSLTANAGLAAVTELCDRLGVIGALDAAVGPVKQRDRGFGAGGLLAGIAAAQLAGEDFLTGLDRQRAGAAGQLITPVPGLASTTAAGLARGSTPAQWQAVESGLAVVYRPGTVAAAGGAGCGAGRRPGHDRPGHHRRGGSAARSAAWRITIRASGWAGRTWRPGPRPRSCWPPTWATAPMTRARPRRTCCAARWPPCRTGYGFGPVAMRADAGYFAGQLARAAHDAKIEARPQLVLAGTRLSRPAGRRLRPGWHGEYQPPGPLPQAGERPDRQGHRS